MRESSWQKQHLVLGMLITTCILIDAGFLFGFVKAFKWLSDMTSPFVPVIVAAVAVLAARVLWSIRWVRVTARNVNAAIRPPSASQPS